MQIRSTTPVSISYTESVALFFASFFYSSLVRARSHCDSVLTLLPHPQAALRTFGLLGINLPGDYNGARAKKQIRSGCLCIRCKPCLSRAATPNTRKFISLSNVFYCGCNLRKLSTSCSAFLLTFPSPSSLRIVSRPFLSLFLFGVGFNLNGIKAIEVWGSSYTPQQMAPSRV